MDVTEEYKSSLNDLNFNSKPLINMLTMLADENKKHAPLIVNTIVNHINSVSPDSMLPGLYLVDSIIKNLGNEYLKIFCEHITSLFSTVFEKVDENTRSLMFKLRQTWTDVLPNKILYNLDAAVKNVDPAWPITAKNPSGKRILVNPKFLDGSVGGKAGTVGVKAATASGKAGIAEEKKEIDPPNAVLKREENEIKQRQGEVLKELLAKQQQLKQLELKKLQLTMKKKTAAMGSPASSLNSFGPSHLRDPRMVKINNASQLSASKNSVLTGKPALGPHIVPLVSCVPDSAKSAKSEIQPVINSKSNVNDNVSENNIQTSNEQSMIPKKVTLKCKNDIVSNKNKLSNFRDKEESVFNTIENATSSIKTDTDCKTQVNSNKTDEKCARKFSRGLRIPKKKSPTSDRSINSQHFINSQVDSSKKKVPSFNKKNEKLKSASNLDTFYSNDKKVSIKNKPVMNFASDEYEKIKKNSLKLDVIKAQQRIVQKTNDSVDIQPIKIESHQHDSKSILSKDEDLRIIPGSLKEETVTKRLSKRDSAKSDPVIETDNLHPPQKKMKSENIENCSPDYRAKSPILFGNEDQDLRQSNNPSTNDVKSKDWTQYKASHPDVYSPGPGRNEQSGGKLRFWKCHSSGFNRYPEHERYGSFKHSRGRYVARRNVRRMHFPRGIWVRPDNSPVGPVMFDSHTCLQQAEERYHSGRLSESEYLDIRRDLQKMVESSEHHYFPYEHMDHFKRNPDPHAPKFRDEYDDRKKKCLVDNIPIQESSRSLPPVKPFVLDGKERVIHFVDDRALILMDNEEPRELTFQNEQRDVFIEGMANPIPLGFDGKSVEFEVDGRRHILRFGTPGRELYINNHPYEAQFGGPPIAVRLEDDHVYKIHLSGPPPPVTIGEKSQFELFAKYHGNVDHPVLKKEFSHTTEKMDTESSFTNPATSSSFQDVDMRVKIENLPHSDVLMEKDIPFYSKDMKDIDWRQIPGSGNPESEENLPKVFESTDMTANFKTWPEEKNDNRIVFHDDRKNQPQNSTWEASMQDHPPIHTENNNISTPSSDESWYYEEENKRHRQYSDYSQTSHMPHSKEQIMYQPPNSAAQQFGGNIRNFGNHRSNRLYPDRPFFQDRHLRGQDSRSSYGPWISSSDFRPRHNAPINQRNRGFRNPQQRPLLPPPPFPPNYQANVDSSGLPEVADNIRTTTATEIVAEPMHDFPHQSGSEMQPPESSTSDFKVDVESLLQKLISAGIINTKPDEQPPDESSDAPIGDITETKETDVPSETIPEIELNSEGLKVHHASVINALHKGLQCATCGMRFKELQGEQYSHHLDWHFRMNRREKDGAKKANFRRWYYEIDVWIQFEEFTDFEERVPSYFELEADSNQPEVIEVPAVVSVPATNDDQECCPVCSERFQLFWVEEEEEWHYRDAVRHDNVTYHPACYEDFKKASELERLNKNVENDAGDIDEEITALMSSLLDNVVNVEAESEKHIEEEVPSSLESLQKESSCETHSEEEILEGKPGEEEIIGLISESDMEIDSDILQNDSKMVVMQSGGITLKVKAQSLQCNSPSNLSEKEVKDEPEAEDNKPVEDEEIDFRPPTPDPNFEERPLVSRGRELSGLCCIM